MPRFHVKDTFEIELSERVFVLAGEIVEGTIKAGMLVHIPNNLATAVTAPIHSIEFLSRRPERDDICLCVKSGTDAVQILREMDVRGKTLEITANESD